MSYFKGDAAALHLALSEDAVVWRAVRGGEPILRPSREAHAIRDPHLVCDQGGTFHLFATGSGRPDALLHATSRDLRYWNELELWPVMAGVANTRNCWAPECFWDAELRAWRVIWSSTVSDHPAFDQPWEGFGPFFEHHDHRVWGCVTHDFKTYSAPAMFFDPGYSVIDACVARGPNGRYLMAFKDERGDNRAQGDIQAIRVGFSDVARGPYRIAESFVTPFHTEGPALLWRGDRWLMYFDYFYAGRYGVRESRDGTRWTDVASTRLPDGARHASVLEVDAMTFTALEEHA